MAATDVHEDVAQLKERLQNLTDENYYTHQRIRELAKEFDDSDLDFSTDDDSAEEVDRILEEDENWDEDKCSDWHVEQAWEILGEKAIFHRRRHERYLLKRRIRRLEEQTEKTSSAATDDTMAATSEETTTTRTTTAENKTVMSCFQIEEDGMKEVVAVAKTVAERLNVSFVPTTSAFHCTIHYMGELTPDEQNFVEKQYRSIINMGGQELVQITTSRLSFSLYGPRNNIVGLRLYIPTRLCELVDELRKKVTGDVEVRAPDYPVWNAHVTIGTLEDEENAIKYIRSLTPELYARHVEVTYDLRKIFLMAKTSGTSYSVLAEMEKQFIL